MSNSSSSSENRIDTCLFVQNIFLKTKNIENILEEDIGIKNQFRIKNLPDAISIREAASTIDVDTLFNDGSIMKDTAHVDLKDKIFADVFFIKIKSLPAIGERLTAKCYADNAVSNSVGEPTLVRKSRDNAFNNFFLTNKNSITLNTQAVQDNQVITISNLDQFHHENEATRRDLGTIFLGEYFV